MQHAFIVRKTCLTIDSSYKLDSIIESERYFSNLVYKHLDHLETFWNIFAEQIVYLFISGCNNFYDLMWILYKCKNLKELHLSHNGLPRCDLSENLFETIGCQITLSITTIKLNGINISSEQADYFLRCLPYLKQFRYKPITNYDRNWKIPIKRYLRNVNISQQLRWLEIQSVRARNVFIRNCLKIKFSCR